jgi:hypothetical protein
MTFKDVKVMVIPRFTTCHVIKVLYSQIMNIDPGS